MGYINKSYLKTQFDNFSNRIALVFARKTDIPTKTSQLENDSGFTTEESSGSVDVLDTMEEIEANTTAGKAAGALAVKELNSSLNLINNPQYTLIKTVTTFSASTDVIMDFSSYDEIVVVVVANYTDSNNATHTLYKLTPNDIELCKDSYMEQKMAPSIRFDGIPSSNTGGAFAYAILYLMSTKNHYRIDKNNSKYNIKQVRFYGLKNH